MQVDFMIVGAQKCGTSTLFDILASHPSIVGSRRKEPGFFSSTRDWRQNLAKYERFFLPKDGALYFEASTQYTYYPYPSRNLRIWDDIFDYNPKMKFIYLVRHPVDRVVSSYMHSYEAGFTDMALEEAIIKDPFFINATRYSTQISPYIRRFGRDRVLLIDFDDLVHRRDVTLREVADFVGVEYSEFKNYEKIHTNASMGKKRHHHKFDTPMIMKALRRVLPSVWKRIAMRDTTRHFRQKPVLSAEYQEIIVNMLALEIRELQRLMNKDLSGWMSLGC